MEHIKCRCKNCGKSYTYCTYGNGPEFGTEAGCSRTYCSECQTALDNIPKKFEPRFLEIQEPLLFAVFDKIKPKDSDNKGPKVVCVVAGYHKYAHCETYTHKGIKYKVEWNDENDKHIFIQMEYDLLKKEFTGELYECEDFRDSYSYVKQSTRDLTTILAESIPVVPLSPPSGKFLWEDALNYEWDIIPSKPYKPAKSVRTLQSYSSDYTGADLKRKHARGELLTSINVANLQDVLTYTCSFQKYSDETIPTLTKIKII